jgi:preprotein translocase subunit SecG
LIALIDYNAGFSEAFSSTVRRLHYLHESIMSLYLVLKAVWIFAALGLVIVVLLHSPKGDGLGGLSGQAQLFNSTKTAELTLNRITWVLTVVFMGLTVVLSANLIPAQ